MDFAFVLDPLPLLKAYKDTSIAMMRAVAGRGHRVYALEQAAIYWHDGATRARARPLRLHADDHDWYDAGVPEDRALRDFAAVLMRKDPPFDAEYFYATHLLEQAERDGARVFNRPRALRDLRVAEVTKLDVKIENGKVLAYRTRLQLSFKYEG